ncbi:MAG: hypothetical protein GC180_01140 [Bacteroidetes bacterium]|nr:hypothetical protein [Bacteroidota bacterium]
MRIFTLLLFSVILLNTISCKKDNQEPAPSTGTIQIVFNGTPSAGFGDKVEFYFAKDLYHLQTNIFSFSKVSNAPHTTITMGETEPQDWYYKRLISTSGPPQETQGTVKVTAGKTATISVDF